MAVELNHTIVAAEDQDAEARFLAEVLGLPEPTRFGPFLVVQTANGVSLDVMRAETTPSQHYAFLISEPEFDEVDARLRERGVGTFADPEHREPGLNRNDGGRGMYFDSPSGHNLEVLTRPYGSGAG
ncbi:MAG TPA: VOC family protein [Pseudonocardia sp.]|jgi:catechol 2,3-dioxygenase-like lactoylglutathione lyase family enzyme|nr:VOC family protein [Pseudonocardia sp.]